MTDHTKPSIVDQYLAMLAIRRMIPIDFPYGVMDDIECSMDRLWGHMNSEQMAEADARLVDAKTQILVHSIDGDSRPPYGVTLMLGPVCVSVAGFDVKFCSSQPNDFHTYEQSSDD